MNPNTHPEPEERNTEKTLSPIRPTYPCDQTLRSQLITFRDESNGTWSNARLAAEIGYNAGVISDYCNADGNKYTGKVQAVEKRIKEFLRDQRLTLDSNVTTIPCDVAEQVIDAIEDIRTSKRIGAIIGEPGIGKSRGIDLYCREHELAIMFTAWLGECNLSSAKECLFKAADVLRGRRGQNEIKALAIAMHGSARPILIDDAHKLTNYALQFFYDFRDHTGCPVVLFGDDRLVNKLKADPQRLRRTGLVKRLKLRDPDPLICHHIEAFCGKTANGEQKEILQVCRLIAEQAGHFGSVQMELIMASRLKRAKPDLSWVEALKHAHKRLLRDYELPTRI